MMTMLMMMLRPCTSLLRQSSFGGVSSSALMGGWLAHSSYSLLRRCSLATTASTPPHAHPSPSSSFSQSNSQFPLKRNSSNNNKNNSNNVINRKTQSNSASAAVKRNNPKSNTSSSPLQPKELMKRLIHIRRISRATGGGKKRSIWALVIVGNGNGSAGYGEGRALDATNAVNKATRDAMKNMIYIDRLDNRTIFSDIKHKFQSVELSMHTQPAGYGIVSNNHIHEVCRCLGIHDIAVKIRGSTNPMNVVKATFEALSTQQTPRHVAMNRGAKVEDVASRYFGDKILK